MTISSLFRVLGLVSLMLCATAAVRALAWASYFSIDMAVLMSAHALSIMMGAWRSGFLAQRWYVSRGDSAGALAILFWVLIAIGMFVFRWPSDGFAERDAIALGVIYTLPILGIVVQEFVIKEL